MSSPSPDPQKGDHTYQSSEASDHGLLTHNHTCTCTEKPIDQNKTEIIHNHCMNKSNHHHNLVPLPATTNHVHPVNQVMVHVHHSPKTTHVTKPASTTCTCHLQDEDSTIQEIEEDTRKYEPDDRIEISPLPPALPPRPPPRPRLDGHGSLSSRYRPTISNPNSGGIRKYVFWCCVCGGLSTILGALFLAVYFLLRTYTSTLGYFETIPTFVPATMLILTGLCVISLARRRNRYSYLIKVCGLCCLVCALTCVLVTITTTVIHMNRLQTLRECVYTQKTRTCTCYSVLLEAHANADDGMRFVFDSTPDCEVIHGALYSCLRAMFGLSVSGILVCIFSCMLVYQLLSHEKKKMYWEQLELRCRSFYQQHSTGPASTHGSVRGPPIPPATYCSCCEECRYPSIQPGPQVYPWDTHGTDRFWAPGRIGNFYSPNPGEDGPPMGPDSLTRERPVSGGWSWRRLPWSRTPNGPSEIERQNSLTYQAAIGSADSQYGFSNRSPGDHLQGDAMSGSTGSYSILDNRPPVGGVYVWGPPPPYSNPNSPARRPMHSPARYHHIHHHVHNHESHCQMNENNQFRVSRRIRSHINNKENRDNKDNYENTVETEVHQANDNSESTDNSSCQDRVSHTLPARKIKKRTDIASIKSINQSNNRTNVQNVFNQDEQKPEEHDYHEPTVPENIKNNNQNQCRFLPRLQGVENAAFQQQESSPGKPETTESEVYFADVSSCCNISLKNDGQDSSLYDEAVEARLMTLQKTDAKETNTNQLLQNFQENISSVTVTEDEDYLAHRMGNRQMSTRSRMPFPLPGTEDITEFPETNMKILPKDISQNSLCSSVQTPMTETTDDGITPEECCKYFPEKNIDTTKHRSFTSNHFLAPDAQYEVIPESSSNLTNTISGVSNFDQNYYNQTGNYNYAKSSVKNSPPKTLNLNQVSSRRNIGSNISALIQNLGSKPAGLLYGEANVDEEIQVHGSDCTMDSGWHSGSEKLENKNSDPNDMPNQKPVNV